MRIGIFNRWLQTQGGGERQTGSAAQALAADSHDVTFITTNPTDLSAVAQRFDLDLSDVGLRVIPDLPYSELEALTAEYDLFINGSHMDNIPSRAPASILFIYFPLPRDLSPRAKLTQRLIIWCAARLGRVRYEYGFYGMELVDVGWYRSMGRSAGFSVPGGRRGVTVQLAVGNFVGTVPLRARFAAQGTEIASVDVAPSAGNFRLLTLRVPSALSQAERVTIDVESEVVEPDPSTPEERRPLGIAISQVTAGTTLSRFSRRLFERNLPRLMLRARTILQETEMDYLNTYDLILANSAFTASWLRRFWDAESEFLYPPVDTTSFVPGVKRPIILSTGRFFTGEHCKRQDVLIDAFRTLVASGVQDWELHLVGTVGEKPADRAFFAQVQKMAQDLPVTLHANADFATLQTLSAQASLYWHATGFGVNEEREPLRVEHFGISVVEAMAAGAVPLAVGKGGVGEIITPGENGILWDTVAELVAATQQLIEHPERRARLSAAAQERSKAFSQQRYGDAMQQIVRQLAGMSPGQSAHP